MCFDNWAPIVLPWSSVIRLILFKKKNSSIKGALGQTSSNAYKCYQLTFLKRQWCCTLYLLSLFNWHAYYAILAATIHNTLIG